MCRIDWNPEVDGDIFYEVIDGEVVKTKDTTKDENGYFKIKYKPGYRYYESDEDERKYNPHFKGEYKMQTINVNERHSLVRYYLVEFVNKFLPSMIDTKTFEILLDDKLMSEIKEYTDLVRDTDNVYLRITNKPDYFSIFCIDALTHRNSCISITFEETTPKKVRSLKFETYEGYSQEILDIRKVLENSK